MTVINETARTLGIAMRQARISAYIPKEQIAQMLHISKTDLLKFETAQIPIPLPVLQSLLACGYTMLNARHIQHRYMDYAKRLRDFNALGF